MRYHTRREGYGLLQFTLFVAMVAASALAAWMVSAPLLRLLSTHGASLVNYRGRTIPTAAGILLVAVGLPAGFSLMAAAPDLGFSHGRWLDFAALYALLTGFGLLGLYDDLSGDSGVRGFGGHMRALASGRLTTGVVKLAGGGILAAAVAGFVTPTFPQWVVGTLVIALSANLINLLDLRPGRAMKFSLLWALIAVSFSVGNVGFWVLWAPIAGVAVTLLILDLRERATLGDSGSNALGAVLGLAVVANFDLAVQVTVLALLTGIHVFAEKRSITGVVEGVGWLRAVDELGRRGKS